jgi:hypothetical protein
MSTELIVQGGVGAEQFAPKWCNNWSKIQMIMELVTRSIVYGRSWLNEDV